MGSISSILIPARAAQYETSVPLDRGSTLLTLGAGRGTGFITASLESLRWCPLGERLGGADKTAKATLAGVFGAALELVLEFRVVAGFSNS